MSAFTKALEEIEAVVNQPESYTAAEIGAGKINRLIKAARIYNKALELIADAPDGFQGSRPIAAETIADVDKLFEEGL